MMSWFKPSSPKHPQEIRVPQVQFLGEQDGPPEQLLKDRLTEFFQRDKSVHRAYLAKVSLGEQSGVALCLKTQFGADRGLAEKIGAIFGMVFNAHEHLDIMFLSDEQESELAKVCSPFFGNPTP
jgi:hypothetical protein